jgi:hypothetical protein
VAGTLAAIALGSTVIALALEAYLGRMPLLALLGQALAALGAAGYALWLVRRGR